MRSATLTLALAATRALAQLQVPFVHESELARASESVSGDAPSYRADLLSLHKSLVSISSTSGLEKDVSRWLGDYLIGLGYKVEFQAVPPRDNTPKGQERLNVIAGRASERYNPTVLVTSHIDVVPPHIPYEIEDGDITGETMIKGRGSVDAKGSVAAQIIAVEDLIKTGSVDPNDILLAFVVGEEVSGDGMRQFSDALASRELPYRIKSAIFGEPTENSLACGHKGALNLDVVAHGVGGHSGYPWLGKSANELLVRALVRIIDADLGSSELFGNTTVNIGRFDGGVAANVIAERAMAKLMIRVAIGPQNKGANVVREKMTAIFNEVDPEAFDLDFTEGYGSVECNCDVDGFDKITTNYGTDIPNLKGPYTNYLYGPGSIMVAHGARENLTVGDLETAVEGFQKLILHALKQ